MGQLSMLANSPQLREGVSLKAAPDPSVCGHSSSTWSDFQVEEVLIHSWKEVSFDRVLRSTRVRFSYFRRNLVLHRFVQKRLF